MFAIYTYDKQQYLITEYIKGETLSEEKWNALSSHDQAIICSKLQKEFELLRSVPAESYYGRVHEQAFNPWFGMVCTRGSRMCGPYYDFEEFKAAVLRAMQLCVAMSKPWGLDWTKEQEELILSYKNMLESTTGRLSLLTHLDPRFENIIVERIDQDDWKVVLIDWESLCWLPAFMQSVALAERLPIPSEQRRQGINLGYIEEEDIMLKVFDKGLYPMI